MDVTSWSSENMNWSGWQYVQPWRREYFEALRAALRDRCMVASTFEYWVELDGQPWEAGTTWKYKQRRTPGVAFGYINSLQECYNDPGMLAFASVANGITSIVAAICGYFADPLMKIEPVERLLSSVMTTPVVFNRNYGNVTYPAPIPGSFKNYTYQSLRRAVSLDGVELVGELYDGCLLDSSYVKKWFFMVKAMICKLVYTPYEQVYHDVSLFAALDCPATEEEHIDIPVGHAYCVSKGDASLVTSFEELTDPRWPSGVPVINTGGMYLHSSKGSYYDASYDTLFYFQFWQVYAFSKWTEYSVGFGKLISKYCEEDQDMSSLVEPHRTITQVIEERDSNGTIVDTEETTYVDQPYSIEIGKTDRPSFPQLYWEQPLTAELPASSPPPSTWHDTSSYAYRDFQSYGKGVTESIVFNDGSVKSTPMPDTPPMYDVQFV